MNIKNARTLGIRLSGPEAKRLEEFEKGTGVEGVTLGRAALFAALDHFEKHKTLAFPLTIVPAKSHPSHVLVHYGSHSATEDDLDLRLNEQRKTPKGRPGKQKLAS